MIEKQLEDNMARTKKDVTAKYRVKLTLNTLRLLRGFDRAAHFAAGGTPADWRGTSDVRPDKRRQALKRACRRPCDDE
jgi:hypothetical protein